MGNSRNNEVGTYILQRLDRLRRLMKHTISLNNKNWDIVVMNSRPVLDIALNLVNLLVLHREYADFLDKESEEQALSSNRDHLKGYISYEDKKSRKAFLRSFNSKIIDKFENCSLNLHSVRTDSSNVLHDNQSSYTNKPTRANIEYIDSIIFFLITQIYKKICSQYGLKGNKHMERLNMESQQTVSNYKILKKKDINKIKISVGV